VETIRQGVHLGAMAGTVDLMQRVSTGIEITWGRAAAQSEITAKRWSAWTCASAIAGIRSICGSPRDTLTVRGRERGAAPINLGFDGSVYEFAGGSTRVFKLASEPA